MDLKPSYYPPPKPFTMLGLVWRGAIATFENATGITMIFIGGLYAAIGSTLGRSITCWVARLGGPPLVDKFAHQVRIDPVHIARAETQFHRWGAGIVLVEHVMPGVRTLINIPAGLARMPFITFFVTTFIGSYAWCSLLIGAGYALGQEWALISQYLKQYFPYLLTDGLMIIAIYILFTSRSFQFAPRRMNE